MVVALDAGDERTAETVDRETSGDVEWFAGREVRRNLVIADAREVDGGRRDCAHGRTGASVAVVPVVDQPVTGVQHAGPAAHPLPAGIRLRLIGGLAVQLTVELEY